MENVEKAGKAGVCLRWAARVLGGLMVLFVLVFVFGEGVAAPSSLSPADKGLFAALAAMLAGVLVSWKRVFAGCPLIAAGLAEFSAIDGSFRHPFVLLLLVVALYALAWAFDRRAWLISRA